MITNQWWARTYPRLDLSTWTSSLCAVMRFVRADNDRMIFAVDADFAEALKRSRVGEIQPALSAYLGRPVQVVFKVEGSA